MMSGDTSRYERDLQGFGEAVCDPGAFHELWHGFEALRVDHAAGQAEAVAVGLGLRPHAPGGPPKPTIVVQLAEDAPGAPPPGSVTGLPVHVETVGEILAGPAPASGAESAFRAAYDAPPCGVSIAPVAAGYAGTLGFYVRDGEKTFMVSCRHVMDPSLNGQSGGPGIQQQAHLDGNLSGRSITALSLVGALEGPIMADVAAAIVEGVFDPRILVGPQQFATIIAPAVAPTPNLTVRKSGRTSGATTSMVDLMSAQVRVSYGNGTKSLFTDCISVRNNTAFYAPGDSGALLTNELFQPLGMLFSISIGLQMNAYVHRIETVLATLNAAAGSGAAFEIVTGGPVA